MFSFRESNIEIKCENCKYFLSDHDSMSYIPMDCGLCDNKLSNAHLEIVTDDYSCDEHQIAVNL